MFEVHWDDHEVTEYIDKAWSEKSVKKTLKAAAGAYGKAGKPILKAATPVGPSGAAPKYGITAGNLQRTVGYKQIRARFGIGVVIGSFRKPFAFYRGWVTGGTRPHLILPKSVGGRLAILGGFATVVHHPGARANPYVTRVEGAVEAAGFAAAEEVVFAGLDAQRVIDNEEG